MSIPGIPTGFQVQTANRQNLVSWDLTPGATSYLVQRSLDNVTYTDLATISGSPLATSYLDTAVTVGTQYWYQVKAVSIDGSSSYTIPQSAIPVPTAEMSLSQLILAAQQRGDLVNNLFITKAEWRSYINQSMFELYDILITLFEDQYVATPVQFVVNGNQFVYPLPDGKLTFQNGLNPNQTITGSPFYKLIGVDLALQNTANAYVTVNKFNFIDRNRFVYPNSNSTIYGVFNMQYRLIGSNIEFIPTPSGNQSIRLWYVPRLNELLQDTDITTIGVSGWLEYVIVKAAYLALTKQEADTSALVTQLVALNKRIEESAANRDAGQADTISNTRPNFGVGQGPGYNGSWGGF